MASSLIGPFGACILVIGGLVWLSARQWTDLQRRALRISAQALILAAALLAALVSWRVALPNRPLAEADLEPGGAAMHVPARSGAIALLASGKLPPVQQGQGAAYHFTLLVQDEAGDVARERGEIEEHWVTRRVGRRGRAKEKIEHQEQRFDLPSEFRGRAFDVRLSEADGHLDGAFHLQALPAPPPALPLEIAAAVIAVAGATLDALLKRRTHFGAWGAILGVFSVMLLTGVTPHGGVGAVMGAAMLAGMIGGAGGMVLRLLASSFLRPREPAQEAQG